MCELLCFILEMGFDEVLLLMLEEVLMLLKDWFVNLKVLL